MLPILGFVSLLLAAAFILIGVVVSHQLQQAQAQIAADAAALASANGDEVSANVAAKANGASLVQLTRDGETVIAVVKCGDSLATARASSR